MDADRLLRLLERADLQENPRMQRLVRVASHADNTAVGRYATTLIEQAAAQHYQYPFDATVDAWQGDLDVGMIIGSSSPYYLEEAQLPKHVLVLGQSGVGKTTFFYTVLDGLSAPAWIFDIKQDYRHLLGAAECPVDVVVPWPELRVNPLRPPPGATPRQWVQVVTEVFGHANALLSASKNYVMQAVIELYDDAGIDLDAPAGRPPARGSERSHPHTADNHPEWPTLHDLHDHLQAETPPRYSKTSSYHDTVANRLDALLSVAGPVFDTPDGFPFTRLLEQTVVFEFNGLRSDFRNFLMELLFAWVFEYRLANTERGTELRHAFILDEGKHIFSLYKERQDAAGLPFIDEMTAELREFGEALLVADQEASKLTDSIKANTDTTVLLSLGDATQFREAVGAMNLSARQREFAQSLGVGQAIIQSGQQAPVPVQLHDFPVEKTVDDTQLATKFQATWTQLQSTTPHEPTLERPQEAEQPAEQVETGEDTADDAPPSEALSEAADRLLHDVADHPYAKLTARYGRLFSSRYKGNKAKTELLEAGLVRERTVEKKYGRPTLLELTQTGRDRLADAGVSVQRTGRGGVVHRYWQQLLKQRFEDAEYTATREADDADVAVALGDGRLAVEVAMEAADRELEHAKQRLADGFDTVWIGCRSDAVQTALSEQVAESDLPAGRVHVRLLQDLQTASLDGI